jgi:penicillin-binding protein 1B
MGLNPRIRGYPSVALGAFEVTPLEIAGAYTAFANGGRRVQPHAIKSIVSSSARVVKTYRYAPQEVLSPQIAYLMTHLMEGVINHGAGVRARGFTLPAAGKTGTSRDGWFAGYTKDLLVITWVGFDDGQDLNLEGARSALPIWAEFMKKAYQLYPARYPAKMVFTPPPGIDLVRIDAVSLARGDPYCGESYEEAFLEGTAPATSCLADWDFPFYLSIAGSD